MNDFYKRLILTRLSMDLSKKDFGALGGVSDMSQGRYEDEDPSKRRFPDVEYLLNLEKHGIDISYLLTGISSSNNLNADESLLLETFRNGNEQSQKLMLDLCRTLSGLPEQPKKKDDQDPPTSKTKNVIEKVKAKNSTQSGDINTTNNNFSTANCTVQPQKKRVKEIAGIIILLVIFISALLSFDPSMLIGKDTPDLALALAVLMVIGRFLYKFGMIPVNYEIDMYFNHKKSRAN